MVNNETPVCVTDSISNVKALLLKSECSCSLKNTDAVIAVYHILAFIIGYFAC